MTFVVKELDDYIRDYDSIWNWQSDSLSSLPRVTWIRWDNHQQWTGNVRSHLKIRDVLSATVLRDRHLWGVDPPLDEDILMNVGAFHRRRSFWRTRLTILLILQKVSRRNLNGKGHHRLWSWFFLESRVFLLFCFDELHLVCLQQLRKYMILVRARSSTPQRSPRF